MEEITLEQIQAIENAEDKVAKLLDYAKAQEEAKIKLQADTDRWVKKVLDEKKYLELIKDEAKVLMKDKNYFPKLLEKDEGLAQKVLDEYFDWISIEDALAQVDENLVKEHKTKEEEKSLDAKVQELFTKKEVALKTKQFVMEAKLTDEEKSSFEKEFKDITDGKKLDENNIDKYIRLAFTEAIPNKDYKEVENIAKEMAVSTGSQTQSKQVVHNARKDNIDYLKSQWFF